MCAAVFQLHNYSIAESSGLSEALAPLCMQALVRLQQATNDQMNVAKPHVQSFNQPQPINKAAALYSARCWLKKVA